MSLKLEKESNKSILLLEPFYGGSHKQLLDVLFCLLAPRCEKICMTDKKWHWRMRTSSFYFANSVPKLNNYKFLFVSAVLNLAELLGLRPDLKDAKKILYFHENQLVYPVRKQKDRDFQFGYNQIMSCMVADIVVFNSKFNQDSFLSSIKTFLNLMPDFKPESNIAAVIKPKCKVLYYPITVPVLQGFDREEKKQKTGPLHIVWAHRWEHDKNPTALFETLRSLKNEGQDFKISVLGQGFTDIPEVFEEGKLELIDHILHWGYQETKDDFLRVLRQADVAVSTANHEFFGVSMLEAVCCGCYPLCPNRLVYPEIFPREYLYNTNNQLLKKLRQFCKWPSTPRNHDIKVELSRFSWDYLKGDYEELFVK